jgi:hypothetical protein
MNKNKLFEVQNVSYEKQKSMELLTKASESEESERRRKT